MPEPPERSPTRTLGLRVALAAPAGGGEEPVTAALAAGLGASARVADCAAFRGPFPGAPGDGPFDVLVYPAAWRGGPSGLPDLADARQTLGRVRAAGVSRVVVVSSAAVHEPGHQHPGMVGEERLAVPRHGNRVAAAWRALESVAQEWLESAGERSTLTLLRPPAVAPGGRDVLSRRLAGGAAGWATVPAGFDPTVQVLALDDLVRGVVRAVEEGAGGAFHLAPRAAIPLRKALAAAGVRRLPVPRGPALGGESAYLAHPWTVSGARAASELAFEARSTSGEAVAAGRGRGRGQVEAGPHPDDFGLDTAYVARTSRTLLRFLHDVYWRVELAGLEHLPRAGPAVLVGVHRGLMPYDGTMVLHVLLRETGRIPRFLIHPALVKFPFLADFMRKLGGVHASSENADRILGRGDVLGIFPEGIRGAFAPYREAYELKRFGRDEFVRMAIRNRAPIVPFATVGSAEIFPILGRVDWPWWSRFSEWPYLPLTPTFPWLPVPLPSKWHTRFLPPIAVDEEHAPADADDREVVRAMSARVRGQLEEAMAAMLDRRRSIFFGNLFEESGGPDVAKAESRSPPPS